MTETATAQPKEQPAETPRSAARRRLKLRPRQLLAKAHRWASFALGIVLLLVVVSGTSCC